MDAGELLGGDAPFVADTSAWRRAASLPSELGTLLTLPPRRSPLDDADRAHGDPLYSARTSSEYAALERKLDALRVLRNDRGVADAAMSALRDWPGAATATTASRSPTR